MAILRHSGIILLALTLAVCLKVTLQADEPVVESHELNLNILSQHQITTKDNRRVIFNRVEPPTIPSSRVSEPDQMVLPVEPSAPAKPVHTVSISCTIYDHVITKLRWSAGGINYTAWSNIDFTDLAGVGHLETDTAIYSLLLGIGHDDPELRTPEDALPSPSPFQGSQAQYVVISATGGSSGASAGSALEAMNALHNYYETHRTELQEKRQQRETERLRVQEDLARKALEPVPDKVINFWPIKSKQLAK